MLPLTNITVLEFSQYLAGPSAGLRLADLGARVIKIERPGNGDACRGLAIRDQWVDDSSLLFHTINRNKESFAADLKDPDDLETVKKLIRRADVLTHNFRPGVMEKIGLDYDHVKDLNPRLIYADITGYGKEGPWKGKPGQDLLVQSLSGMTWLTGNRDDLPTPMGLAVADMLCGCHLAQGILALLARRDRTGRGGTIEASLLESSLDLQFEVLTTYFQDRGKTPARCARGNAHAYLGAPYGVYATRDGSIALAMGDLRRLMECLPCEQLAAYLDNDSSFRNRDPIMALLQGAFEHHPTAYWLERLQRDAIWCADVFDYETLHAHEGYRSLDMEQELDGPGGVLVKTLKCPIRINGSAPASPMAAPAVGAQNKRILGELGEDAGSPPATSVPAEADGELPLAGITVLDFSQFLSGPCCSLRLADLGARVIKVEKTGGGDICRALYVSDVQLDEESTIFHAINRNKESLSLDLKDPRALETILGLVAKVDMVLHNFRPGVAERLGIDYENLSAVNPSLVFGEINGYGTKGPWKDDPGQDLLLQSLSGMAILSGNADQGPVPMGLSIVDILAGQQLAQGLLAALHHRNRTGEGARIEVPMLASALDLQFETWTTFLQDGKPVERTRFSNAHAFIAAPYGIYETADGYLALAMGRIPQLGELLACPPLCAYENPAGWFSERDAIKAILENHIRTKPTADWLTVLEPADIWCAEVLDWPRLMAHDGFTCLGMKQTVNRSSGTSYETTRCPIRIDGEPLYADKGSPAVGEHTTAILDEFARL